MSRTLRDLLSILDNVHFISFLSSCSMDFHSCFTKREGESDLIGVNSEISVESLIPPSCCFPQEAGGRETANQKELGFGFQ